MLSPVHLVNIYARLNITNVMLKAWELQLAQQLDQTCDLLSVPFLSFVLFGIRIIEEHRKPSLRAYCEDNKEGCSDKDYVHSE